MRNPKITLLIIVSVCNVALYLRKSVESLLSQHLNDYEIILVDDGSTDGSSAICDEYAKASLSGLGTSSFSEVVYSFIQIRMIHQENSGLSAVRNAEIKATKGEYICFAFWLASQNPRRIINSLTP